MKELLREIKSDTKLVSAVKAENKLFGGFFWKDKFRRCQTTKRLYYLKSEWGIKSRKLLGK